MQAPWYAVIHSRVAVCSHYVISSHQRAMTVFLRNSNSPQVLTSLFKGASK